MKVSFKNISAVFQKEITTITRRFATFVNIGLYLVISVNVFSSIAAPLKDIFPIITSLFTFFMCSFLLSQQVFLSEVKNNVLDFLFTTPLNLTELIFGKSFTIISIYFVLSLLLFLGFGIYSYGFNYISLNILTFAKIVICFILVFFPFLNIIALLQLKFGNIVAFVSNMLLFLLFYKLKPLLTFLNKGISTVLAIIVLMVILYVGQVIAFNRINIENLLKSV